MLAGAADYALTTNLSAIPAVHKLTKHLANALFELGVHLLLPVDTTIIAFDTTPLGFSHVELAERAKKEPVPIKLSPNSRMVLHFQTAPEAVDLLIDLVKRMKQERIA